MANIPFTIAGFYTNESGVYTDPQTQELLPSGPACCMRIDFPCTWVADPRTLSINSTDGPCIFSWCKFQKDISSLAASNLLVADANSAIDPALTAAEKNAAEVVAKLIACATC